MQKGALMMTTNPCTGFGGAVTENLCLFKAILVTLGSGWGWDRCMVALLGECDPGLNHLGQG